MCGCVKKSLYKLSNVALFAQQYLYHGLVFSWQFFSVSTSEQKKYLPSSVDSFPLVFFSTSDLSIKIKITDGT